MAALESDQVSQLLADWQKGDPAALEKLIPLVYNELRRLAHHYLRQERPGQTLQTTEIVHEAYLRLVQSRSTNGAPFFAVAAQIMRSLLVDRARSRNSQKRGGGAIRITLNDEMAVAADARPGFACSGRGVERIAASMPLSRVRLWN